MFFLGRLFVVCPSVHAESAHDASAHDALVHAMVLRQTLVRSLQHLLEREKDSNDKVMRSWLKLTHKLFQDSLYEGPALSIDVALTDPLLIGWCGLLAVMFTDPDTLLLKKDQNGHLWPAVSWRALQLWFASHDCRLRDPRSPEALNHSADSVRSIPIEVTGENYANLFRPEARAVAGTFTMIDDESAGDSIRLRPETCCLARLRGFDTAVQCCVYLECDNLFHLTWDQRYRRVSSDDQQF